MHPNSAIAYGKYGRPYVKGDVLEIGADRTGSLLRPLSPNCTRWDTADIRYGADLTLPNSEPYAYPVPDASYDTVVSANVLEHVREPWMWMREQARIVRPGGRVVLVTPANWPFHQDPIDCWRAWPDGLKALFEWAGLTPVLVIAAALDTTAPDVIDTVGVATR